MRGKVAKALRRVSAALERRSVGPMADYPGGPVRHPGGTRRAIYRELKKAYRDGGEDRCIGLMAYHAMRKKGVV